MGLGHALGVLSTCFLCCSGHCLGSDPIFLFLRVFGWFLGSDAGELALYGRQVLAI